MLFAVPSRRTFVRNKSLASHPHRCHSETPRMIATHINNSRYCQCHSISSFSASLSAQDARVERRLHHSPSWSRKAILWASPIVFMIRKHVPEVDVQTECMWERLPRWWRRRRSRGLRDERNAVGCWRTVGGCRVEI